VVEAVGMRYLIAISVRGLIAKTPWTTTASARSLPMVVKARSSSSGPWIITTGFISVPVGSAARRTSSTIAFANTEEEAVPNTPTRRTDGSISRNNSTDFALDAAAIRDTPVMFPPGRAKLATRPLSTGSAAIVTIGISFVAASPPARWERRAPRSRRP
jgi:hypothetical protein